MELNFCVRYGYRWTLHAIFTSFSSKHALAHSKLNNTTLSCLSTINPSSWSSPRSISTGQLHTLLHFHLRPIYHIVYVGPYYLSMGYLISRGASRLDAFSVYPVRTWLPSHAFGKTTGAPGVRPSRSSRTKDSSSQISYAHAG